jgi:hypothetical protein
MCEPDIADEVRFILKSLGEALPAFDHKSTLNFIEYGEYEIAVDTLCHQMCEYNVVPTRTAYEKLMSIVSRLRLDEESYKEIIPLPQD